MVLILCKILVLIPRPLPVVDFEMLFDSEGTAGAKFRTKKPQRFTVTFNRAIFQCPPPFLEITSHSGEHCCSIGSLWPSKKLTANSSNPGHRLQYNSVYFHHEKSQQNISRILSTYEHNATTLTWLQWGRSFWADLIWCTSCKKKWSDGKTYHTWYQQWENVF